MYGLKAQLARIFKEGLENRFQRHKDLAKEVRSWVSQQFDLFAEPGYESDTVTCAGNPNKIDLIEMANHLLDRGYMISGGYGTLKGKTFRIAHMGNLQMDDIRDLLTTIDNILDDM